MIVFDAWLCAVGVILVGKSEISDFLCVWELAALPSIASCKSPTLVFTVDVNDVIKSFNALPCFADKGLFVAVEVRLSTISVTLTLFVVTLSIRVLFDLI